jgi:hypothetical protein
MESGISRTPDDLKVVNNVKESWRQLQTRYCGFSNSHRIPLLLLEIT